jgi:hypothetical protein
MRRIAYKRFFTRIRGGVFTVFSGIKDVLARQAEGGWKMALFLSGIKIPPPNY